jgi:hypothetical protein
MSIWKNTGAEPVAFRDDAGKRIVEPGGTFVLAGDQHAPLAETMGLARQPDPEPVAPDANLDELQAQAEALGVKPASRRKADVRAAVVAVTGEAEREPV